ncbi:aldo/keto reductase [Agrobacterium sp. AGB01]|uniref:aldo/keto reductase n=1 Tax=Agrobacterium sp. AGB01 TaxID=2769302 RepID=UPI00178140DE|nr:aldo/keto reductase [Agrobacterium sp. AGB01]MBD9388547.1 aldo/keto reductase [Agrobacterium sp. AGB01]
MTVAHFQDRKIRTDGPLDLGPFVFGGNIIGWTLTADKAGDLLDEFLLQGGRAIDTADNYTEWVAGGVTGQSESVLGEWLQSPGKRQKIILGSKVGLSEARKGLRRDNILSALDASLKRLGTDYLDIYYAHKDDPDSDLLETLTTFHELVRQGIVGRIGYSHLSPERYTEIKRLIRKHALTPITVFQHDYSIVSHKALDDNYTELTSDPNIQVLGYHAMASGFLSGKYRDANVWTEHTDKIRGLIDDPRAPALQNALHDIAKKHSVSPAAIALAWFRTRPIQVIPLASARDTQQLSSLFESTRVHLDEDDLRLLVW